MTDITTKARGFIAGEIAASGTRPAADVASGILARLQRQGLAVVDASQAQAVSALAGLDAILDLRGAAGTRSSSGNGPARWAWTTRQA
ncbi:hypothetical protein ACFQWF_20195 [Methylorubrum suomiense]